MILTLLSHQWKAFWRSRDAGRSIAMKLLAGFIILYLVACCFFIGISLRNMLTHVFPGQAPASAFCGLILYYFCFDLIMRYFFQELPSLAVQPYLTQNIRRNQLVAFLNLRSLFHFLNLVPLVLLLPFTFMAIPSAFGWPAAMAIAFSILALTAFNNFLMLYVMRKGFFNTWWIVGFTLFLIVLILLHRLKIVSIFQLSATAFNGMLHRPIGVIIPLTLAVLAWFNNLLFLRRNLYLEEMSRDRKKKSAEYNFLRKWGMAGELAALDIKMILRNRRTRALLVLTFAVLSYGFIYYKPVFLHPMKFGIILMGAFFITGAFIFSFGRFAFAWQSIHFDGMMSANLQFAELIRGKLLLYNLVATVTLLISSAYAFLDWHLIPIQIATWLFNIGCNSILSLWMATFNYKYLDLSKSSAFNYQGTGGSENFIYMLFIALLPVVIYLPLSLAISPWAGIAALGVTGLISLLLRNVWINLLVKEFYKRKHLILQGFREK